MTIAAFNYVMTLNLLALCITIQASAPTSQASHVCQKNPVYQEIETLRSQLSNLPAPSLDFNPEKNTKIRQERARLIETITQIRQDWVKVGNKLVYAGNPEFYPGQIPEYIYAPAQSK
ncbi:MAG: hypothetical protein P4L31_01365 [Candidatus Babeliales bacterium]|nr:hypothetical protein [Candidatus Babeliales bacterium]